MMGFNYGKNQQQATYYQGWSGQKESTEDDHRPGATVGESVALYAAII